MLGSLIRIFSRLNRSHSRTYQFDGYAGGYCHHQFDHAAIARARKNNRRNKVQKRYKAYAHH